MEYARKAELWLMGYMPIWKRGDTKQIWVERREVLMGERKLSLT